MNRLICLTDWTILRRERVVILLMAITLCLSCLALYNGQKWANVQHNLIEDAHTQQKQSLMMSDNEKVARQQNKGPINWWDDRFDLRGQAFYLMVNYAAKPPLPSAAIAVGQSDILPYYFHMLVSPKQDFIHQYETVHPLLLLLGKFDLAFLIIYLVPLLIIGVSFNALASEKQSGQLRLLMIQGISPRRLLINQLCLRISLIIVPVLIIINAGLVWFSPQISLLILISLSLLIIAYTLFWLMLCATIISAGKTGAYNASMLVIIWLVLIVVTPALINTIINVTTPAPSRVQYLDQLRLKTDEINNAQNETLTAFFEDHPELVTAKQNTNNENESISENITALKKSYALTKIAKINALEQAMKSHDEEFYQVLLQQQRSTSWLKYLSPATLMQQAFISLSGNNTARHQNFIDQVLVHHEKLRDFYQKRIASAQHQGKFTPCAGCNAEITMSELTAIPKFEYQVPDQIKPWPTAFLFFILSIALFMNANYRLRAMNNAGRFVGA